MSDDHSVTNMLNNLREGHDVSQAQWLIWNRFFHRLKGLADKKLDGKTRRTVDGEDIVVEALNDFFAQVDQDGAFPQLTDRGSLWPLLAKITSRKAINEFNRAKALKRGGGYVRGESAFDLGNDDDVARGIEHIERELTPEFADELFLGFGSVLNELRRHDIKFYDVAVLRLKGYSSAEIAEKLGYKNARTPERIVKQIRILWKSFHGGLATVSVVDGVHVLFETPINDEPTIVGRQRQGDPAPYWTGVSDLRGQAIRRIIVADNQTKAISRNHVTIQIKDESTLEVTNSSQKSKVVIDEDTILAPGEHWTSNSSCTIQLTDLDDSILTVDLD